MLHATKGIVLKALKFSETSAVVHIYTEKFGRLAYMVNGVYSPKSKFKGALLQPLTVLDMISYHKEHKNLQRLSEIKPCFTFFSLPFDIVKSTIAIFISEILYKVLREEQSDTQLFAFLERSIFFLDNTTLPVNNFHVLFLLQLSAFLGIFPQNNFFYTERSIFDLEEGIFTHRTPTHHNYLALPVSELLAKSLLTPIEQSHNLPINKTQRRELLHALLRYYEIHIEGFGSVRSLKILEEL